MSVIGTPVILTAPEEGLLATPTAGTCAPCGTPQRGAVLTPLTCSGQNVLAAPVSLVNGQTLLSRMRSIQVSSGQAATIQWTMIDRDGNPLDLSACLGSSESSVAALSVKLRLREYLSLGRHGRPAICEFDATVTDASNGVVEVSLPVANTIVPGVYFAEMAVCGTDDDDVDYTVFSNTFYVVVNRGLWSTLHHKPGPPSIAEIRLHLRDSNPSESFLLDNLAFDDAEMAMAIARPIEYWNEIPPPIRTYTTQSFPFRFHWLEGICGQLFMMVAEQHRRNELKYSAAGVSIDDYSKEGNYEQAAQRRWGAYVAWVRFKKGSLNLEGAYGTVRSPYAG